MPDQIEIQPTGPLHATIRPPGSKSITNRALTCAALAAGQSILRGALDSEDTRVMIDSLKKLGIRVDAARATVTVDGCAGEIPATQADLFAANSGTTIRFLTAMLSTARGAFRLDGIPRMRERPMGDLLRALRELGADIVAETDDDRAPVVVSAAGLPGGTASVRGDASSQFLSALLMAAPYAREDVELRVEGELVSKPYIDITMSVMSAFGVVVAATGFERFCISAPQRYQGREYDIEPDASAASYFWGAAAIAGGTVTVEGLSRDALQGDVGFCECLEKMGCRTDYRADGISVTGGALRGIEVDMSAISDTAQTLAAVALFADGATTITGVGHIRHKETDRIGDLARELRRVGAEVDELPDGMRITPRPLRAAEIETYNDHRMAMSMALVGLRVPGIVIKDPACTAKTYPGFFEDLQTLSE